MHKTIVIGKVGRDSKEVESGNNVCTNFTIVSVKRYNDENGQPKEISTWFDCAIWRKKGAQSLTSVIKQGMILALEGEVSSRTYQANDPTKPVKSSLVLKVVNYDVVAWPNENQQVNHQPSDDGDF